MPDYDNPELFDTIRRQLDSGSTFGELALLQSNSMTSATIITNTKCEFACMDRSAVFNMYDILDDSSGNIQENRNSRNWMRNWKL